MAFTGRLAGQQPFDANVLINAFPMYSVSLAD
jgi:hypothetical protein